MPDHRSWRDKARPIISCVLKATEGQDDKAIRAALRDAYPFGPRENYPYIVWCDEIRRQRRLGKYAMVPIRKRADQSYSGPSLFDYEEVLS